MTLGEDPDVGVDLTDLLKTRLVLRGLCLGVGRSTFQVAMRISSSGKVDSVS